jgi:GT2 family glycosyltransferase
VVSLTAAIRAGATWVVPGNRWDLLPPPTEPAHVTAVVTHYDDPARLALVLAALDVQTHPASRLQVVVADDGSPTAPVVPSHVQLVRQPDLGFRAAAARNLGAGVADGDVLCFLDGDTVPEPGYIAAVSALPGVCADALVVGRRRHADLEGWDAARLRAWFEGRTDPPRELQEPRWLVDAYAGSRDLLDADHRSYRFVISAVLAVHRDLFAAAGGFDESFTEYGGEDWEFAHRAFTAGAVLAHRRDAVAWHDGPDWAERGDDDARRAQKRREHEALARRIPDPVERGEGSWPSAPRVLAEVHGGTTTARNRLVDALQTAVPDLVVGPVDRGTMQRIPWRLRVAADVAIDPAAVPGLLERGEAEGAGRLLAPGVELTAARAANRAARHGIALERLFPEIRA